MWQGETSRTKPLHTIFLHIYNRLCSVRLHSSQCTTLNYIRADLKVTHLRRRSQICGFLRFSAKIFGFLRKSADSCALQMLEFPGKGWICENLRFSAKICGLGSLYHLSSIPLSAPRYMPARPPCCIIQVWLADRARNALQLGSLLLLIPCCCCCCCTITRGHVHARVLTSASRLHICIAAQLHESNSAVPAANVQRQMTIMSICLGSLWSQLSKDFTGWLRNRTGTGNRNRRNRFSRNRKRNRNRRNRFPGTETVLSCYKLYWNTEETFFAEEPPEPKTGTARTAPPPNRNRTEPGPPWLYQHQRVQEFRRKDDNYKEVRVEGLDTSEEEFLYLIFASRSFGSGGYLAKWAHGFHDI